MPVRKKAPEDLTAKKTLALEVIRRLKAEYPDAGCTLDYDHAWQLLVSVRLAAQCTDARVNIVVEELFAKYPSVAALAAAGAIAQTCPGLDPGIKWPNDVILNGKKCVGILSELAADMDGLSFVIPGVGINVNQTAFEGELREKATSLLIELRKADPNAQPVCRRQLLLSYLRHMESAVDAMEREGLAGILDQYVARSVTLGRRVKVIGLNGEFTGTAQSIDETGALIVTEDGGGERRVLSGDVSVRGLMGYC